MESILGSLQQIIQEVNSAPDLQRALKTIVGRTREVMGAEVCSVYLHHIGNETEYDLVATDGLKPDSIGKVRLRSGEGLVGLVAQTAVPVNVPNAPADPRYVYVPGTDEELFRGFLAVPMIHQRRVLGVLAAMQRAEQPFSEPEVALMITLAAQLSGSIAHAEALGSLWHLRDESNEDERQLDGHGGAPGVAFGTAVVMNLSADLRSVPHRMADDIETEEQAFMSAVQSATRELDRWGADIARDLGEVERSLFDTYGMMLKGGRLIRDTVRRIHTGLWAPAALRETIEEHAHFFEVVQDTYLQQRASDIRQLGRLVLTQLQSEGDQDLVFPERTILVGEELSAIDLARVPVKKLVGVVSGQGSALSHVSILAHAMAIPSVMGLGDLPLQHLDGQPLVIDGYAGRVYVNPGEAVRTEFNDLARQEEELSEILESMKGQPSVTTDGARITLYSNSGLIQDISPALLAGAEGVGLYRTELPFMLRERFPSEEEQRSIYRHVFEAFAPSPVVLRTLDIGGEKPLPYFPIHEPNPSLGWRGIRISLDHPEIFLAQVRAAIRANIGLGNMRLLLPMVSDLQELEAALGLIHQARDELAADGIPAEIPRIGTMIEVPSAVFLTEQFARLVDFISVGTNDLTQYMLAADRGNPRVAGLLDTLHPAVLHALSEIAAAGKRADKMVYVCGEAAADPCAVLLLLGMGINALSMGVGDLPRIRWVIRTFSKQRAEELLSLALKEFRAERIRALLNDALDEAGLGALVRAGN